MDGLVLIVVFVIVIIAMLTCESLRVLARRCLPKSPIERVGCNEGDSETRVYLFLGR